MFCLGAGGYLHELLLQTGERPWVLAMSGYMMGLPWLLAADRLPTMRGSDEEEEEETTKEERWSHLP